MSEYEQRTIVEMTRQLQMRFPGVSQDICIGFAESLARVALKRWQRRPWTRPPWQSGRRTGQQNYRDFFGMTYWLGKRYWDAMHREDCRRPKGSMAKYFRRRKNMETRKLLRGERAARRCWR